VGSVAVAGSLIGVLAAGEANRERDDEDDNANDDSND